MPVTSTEWPILTEFLCVVEKSTGIPPQPEVPTGSDGRGMSSSANQRQPPNVQDATPKQLPKGVVLDKDGKPCRSCTSFAAWAQMTKSKQQQQTQSPASAFASMFPQQQQQQQAADVPDTLPADCPPDVERLGSHTWTLLHTLTAVYPPQPSPQQQQQTRSFLSLFSNMYPCSHCAADFQDWMAEPGNAPRLSSRGEFGMWMCEAHNAVNEKLGKTKFDCNRWEERWITGPPDGRCG